MTDLRFEYKDGRVTAAILDLPGEDFRVSVSGIDAEELKRLQAVYEKLDPARLQALDMASLDGLSLEEKEIIAEEIIDAMRKTGVDGSFSFSHDGMEHRHSVAHMLPVSPQSPGTTEKPATKLEKEFQDAFEEATGTKVPGLDLSRNSISFSKEGKELRLSLVGLSEEEAHQLESHLLQNPELATSFTTMLQAVGEDLQITDAERDLVNNNTEQLLIGAGVSADVAPGSIAASLIPGFKR